MSPLMLVLTFAPWLAKVILKEREEKKEFRVRQLTTYDVPDTDIPPYPPAVLDTLMCEFILLRLRPFISLSARPWSRWRSGQCRDMFSLLWSTSAQKVIWAETRESDGHFFAASVNTRRGLRSVAAVCRWIAFCCQVIGLWWSCCDPAKQPAVPKPFISARFLLTLLLCTGHGEAVARVTVEASS